MPGTIASPCGRAVFVAVAALIGPLQATARTASAAAGPVPPHHRACGTTRAAGGLWKVGLAGPITCAQARHLLQVYESPAAKLHGSPGAGLLQMYVTVPGGWRCTPLNRGMVGCSRGANRAAAKVQVVYTLLG